MGRCLKPGPNCNCDECKCCRRIECVYSKICGDVMISGNSDGDPISVDLAGDVNLSGSINTALSGSVNTTLSGSVNNTISGSINTTLSGQVDSNISGAVAVTLDGTADLTGCIAVKKVPLNNDCVVNVTYNQNFYKLLRTHIEKVGMDLCYLATVTTGNYSQSPILEIILIIINSLTPVAGLVANIIAAISNNERNFVCCCAINVCNQCSDTPIQPIMGSSYNSSSSSSGCGCGSTSSTTQTTTTSQATTTLPCCRTNKVFNISIDADDFLSDIIRFLPSIALLNSGVLSNLYNPTVGSATNEPVSRHLLILIAKIIYFIFIIIIMLIRYLVIKHLLSKLLGCPIPCDNFDFVTFTTSINNLINNVITYVNDIVDGDTFVSALKNLIQLGIDTITTYSISLPPNVLNFISMQLNFLSKQIDLNKTSIVAMMNNLFTQF